MSSPSPNNFPALEMANCPNCGYAIEQLGKRTSCAKCGKKITILCIACQSNNPPVFQFCMRCGVDFRLLGVEHFHKHLAKLEFDLSQLARNIELAKTTTLIIQAAKLAAIALPIIVALLLIIFGSIYLTALVSTALLLVNLLLFRFFARPLARKLTALPAELDEDWQPLAREAEKLRLQKVDVERELAFYQLELNRFRKKG